MDASIIWENPGLTLLGVLASIFLILLLPIVSALRRSREKRDDVALRAREPSVFDDRNYDDRYYDERLDYGSYFTRDSDVPPSDRRRSRDDRDNDVPVGRFGAGAHQRKSIRAAVPVKTICFIIGIGVGAGGLALWWSLPPVNTLTSVLALFDRPDPSPATAERPAAPVDTKVQDRIGASDSEASAAPFAIGDGAGEGVGEMVESFVANLKAQLPMSVGPGITMVNVDSEGSVVALGFTIAQTVAEEDAPKLQSELESRFESNVCATPPDPTNIHGLNERGVSFIITYVDLRGEKVAGLTVEPRFCSNPA